MAKDTRLYVGGLFCGVTDADLIGRFEKFGDVSSVHIVRRTDDKGKPERTFAYVNLTTTDQNLKKCMAVYNKSKWKGHDMQIQVARESFLARLAKEREATKMELNAKEPSVMQTSGIPEPSHGRQWTVQGAAPGTAVEGERNWVVGKYGRILPVVYIRRKDKKKVMKVNPSKYSHNLKKVKEEHTLDTPISQLTWNIQVQGSEESRKKRQGDFSDFMKGRWKRSAATLQTKNKKMKMDLGHKSEEHLSNGEDSDPNISSKSIVQSVAGKDDTGDFGGRGDNQTIQDVSKTSAVENSQSRVDESDNDSKSSKEFSNTTTIDVGHADDDDSDFEVVSLEQHDQRMTGVLDGNMLLGFKNLVHKKQGEGKGDDSDGSVDTDELITATKHHLVQHINMEETLESGTAETSVSSRQKLQQGTAQVVVKNSSSNQDSTDDVSESEASDDAEMIAAARAKLQTIMSSPHTIKNGGKQAEKGLKVPVTTEPEKSTTEVSTSTDVQESISMDGATDHMVKEQPLEKTGRRKDSCHGMEMTCPSNLGQEQRESNTSHNSTQQESNIDDDNSYEDTHNLPIETPAKGGHCQKIDKRNITGKTFESFKSSNNNWEDADDSNSQKLTDTSDTIPSLPEDNKNTSISNAVFEASDDDGGSYGGDSIDDDEEEEEEDEDGDNIDDEEEEDDDGDNIDDNDDDEEEEDVDDGDNIDDEEDVDEEEEEDDDGDNDDDDEEDVEDDGDNIDEEEDVDDEEEEDDDGDNIDEEEEEDVDDEEEEDDDGDNIDDDDEEDVDGDNIDDDEEEDVDDGDNIDDDDDEEDVEDVEDVDVDGDDEEEEEDVDGGDDNVDSDDHVVDADEEDDNDNDCNDELEDDESPDSDSTAESLSELHSFEENEPGNESSSEDSSDPEDGRYKEVKMTTNKSPDGTFPTEDQKVLEGSASNVTVSGPNMSKTSTVDIRKGPVDQQTLQSSAVGGERTLANEQRLQSLRERQLQAQSKQDLIRKALSPMASSTAGKHTVFDSEEEGGDEDGIEVREETWSSTHQPTKTGKKTPQMGLFESDSEEDSVGGSEDSDDRRFQIKPQFEGKTGEKLLELQAQIGQDDRFRMDHRFLEEDSDGDEDDMTKTPTCTDGTGVAEELEAEKQKALEILRSVVGTKAAMATEKGKNIDKLKFKDPSAVRYDPTREDHKQFEIPENESQKDVEESGAGTYKEPKITPPEETVPNTTEDRYFQVASDLKEAFSGTGGQTFSFFGPSSAETIEDMEADSASEPTQTAPKKSPWQPKVFQYDSSDDDDDDDDEITQEDLEKIPEKVEEPKRRNAFFFTDDDSRLKEGMMQFYRRDKLEDIREAWEEVRPELLEESKKRHKNAVRQRKKNQKNRPRHKYK